MILQFFVDVFWCFFCERIFVKHLILGRFLSACIPQLPGEQEISHLDFFSWQKKQRTSKNRLFPFTQTHPSNQNLSPGPTRFQNSTNDFPKVGGSIDLRESSRWGLGLEIVEFSPGRDQGEMGEMGDGSYIPPIWRIYWCLYLICPKYPDPKYSNWLKSTILSSRFWSILRVGKLLFHVPWSSPAVSGRGWSSWGFSIPMGRGFYTHDSDFLLAATSWRCWR